MSRLNRTLAAGAALLAVALGTSACVGPPASHWAKQNNLDCPFEPDESITTHATLAFQMIPNGDRIVQNQRMLETCMPNASIDWKRFESAGTSSRRTAQDPSTTGSSAPRAWHVA